MNTVTSWYWRYLPRYRTLHALSDPRNRMARCGVDHRGRGWRGDASKAERDYAADLAYCYRCMQFIGARVAPRDERGRIAAAGAS